MTDRFIIMHKNINALEQAVAKLMPYCPKLEYISDIILRVESYLSLEEINSILKDPSIKVFLSEKEILTIDYVLEEISKRGMEYLGYDEKMFLRTYKTE